MKTLRINEVVPFREEQYTERGERVYTSMQITLVYPTGNTYRRIIDADRGMGFTEEYIEETIEGGLKALERDFPDDEYEVERKKPNVIVLKWARTKGKVN